VAEPPNLDNFAAVSSGSLTGPQNLAKFSAENCGPYSSMSLLSALTSEVRDTLLLLIGWVYRLRCTREEPSVSGRFSRSVLARSVTPQFIDFTVSVVNHLLEAYLRKMMHFSDCGDLH